MSEEIGDYQRGFEWGVLVGLRTAEVAVREAGAPTHFVTTRIQAAIGRLVAEMKDVRDRRRGIVHREAEHGDIYTTPIAHPADFGLPASPADDTVSAASRIGLAA